MNEYKNKIFLFDISINFGYFFYFGVTTLNQAIDCDFIDIEEKKKSSIYHFTLSKNVYTDKIKFGTEINNLKL